MCLLSLGRGPLQWKSLRLYHRSLHPACCPFAAVGAGARLMRRVYIVFFTNATTISCGYRGLVPLGAWAAGGGCGGMGGPYDKQPPHADGRPEPGASVGQSAVRPGCAPCPGLAVRAPPFGGALHQHHSPPIFWGARPAALAADGTGAPDSRGSAPGLFIAWAAQTSPSPVASPPSPRGAHPGWRGGAGHGSHARTILYSAGPRHRAQAAPAGAARK